MKTRTKAIIAAGAGAVIGGVALAGAAHADKRMGSRDGDAEDSFLAEGYAYEMADHRSGQHHSGKRRHAEGRLERLLEAYDADVDGKLTQAELDAGRARRLGEFDRDGDAQLTLQEYEALWLDVVRERMVDRFQALDRDGDAVVTAEEFAEPYKRLVKRMDRNGDGELSAADLRRTPRGDDSEQDDDD